MLRDLASLHSKSNSGVKEARPVDMNGNMISPRDFREPAQSGKRNDGAATAVACIFDHNQPSLCSVAARRGANLPCNFIRIQAVRPAIERPWDESGKPGEAADFRIIKMRIHIEDNLVARLCVRQ